MNTFCELEEVYGDINKAFDDLQAMKIKAIRALIYAAIKPYEEDITIKDIGELLGLAELEEVSIVINKALTDSMPELNESPGE